MLAFQIEQVNIHTMDILCAASTFNLFKLDYFNYNNTFDLSSAYQVLKDTLQR